MFKLNVEVPMSLLDIFTYYLNGMDFQLLVKYYNATYPIYPDNN